MIDIKVTTLGAKEIQQTISLVDAGIQSELRDELAMVGEEIVSRAQALAPKNTGIMASKIIWYFGQEARRGPRGHKVLTPVDVKWKDGRIRMTVRPRGRVAHLMERGVNAAFQQRLGARRASSRPTNKIVHPSGWRYERTMVIRPRPFFMPAVDSVGGSSGVNARLQQRLDSLAKNVQRGAA